MGTDLATWADTLTQLFERQRAAAVADCTRCGQCVEVCPVIEHTTLAGEDPGEVQGTLVDFLDGGHPSERVYARAFACMECFKCAEGVCPVDLNPFQLNEVVKAEYRRRGLVELRYTNPSSPQATQRVLASVQTTRLEFEQILTPSPVRRTEYVFFSGCNVFAQPDKLLQALDLLVAVGEDFAYLPGLDFCCGDAHIFMGDPVAGEASYRRLLERVSAYEPAALVFWCPTCLCRFEKVFAPLGRVPFRLLTFPQYLAQVADRLPIQHPIDATATLHEACKVAYTGLDPEGPRKILRHLPGLRLVEMPHHGVNTSCCGSGAVTWFPASYEAVADRRLAEAARTGADFVVDVCHYCHATFSPRAREFGYQVVNYVTLIARACGFEREDRYRKWAEWGDLDRIWEDAKDFITASTYPPERIRDVLQATFEPGAGPNT